MLAALPRHSAYGRTWASRWWAGWLPAARSWQSSIFRLLQLDPALFNPRADYLLKVRGMSMRDAGILEGDLLAVHRTSEARSGQIVVARLGNEVTVKRFKRLGNQVQLLPENPDFDPILVDLKRDFFAIEGLGVGIIRNGKAL
jgi:repressor LexA